VSSSDGCGPGHVVLEVGKFLKLLET